MLSLLDERDALKTNRIAELEANLAKLAEDQQKAIESIKQADSAVKFGTRGSEDFGQTIYMRRRMRGLNKFIAQ